MKDFIGDYNNYLPVTMNAEVVTQLKILSQQLLNKDIVLAAQKNHINLESVRVMSSQTIQSFVELLLTKYSQKYIETMLTDDKLRRYVEKKGKAINIKELHKRIAQNDKDYNDLLVKYEELKRVSEEKELKEKVSPRLEEKIFKKQQTYFELQKKYEELQRSLSLGNEVQTELTNLQLTVKNVNTSLLGDKVYSYVII